MKSTHDRMAKMSEFGLFLFEGTALIILVLGTIVSIRLFTVPDGGLTTALTCEATTLVVAVSLFYLFSFLDKLIDWEAVLDESAPSIRRSS